MNRRLLLSLLAAPLLLAAHTAPAARPLKVAIIPTGYFSADGESAAKVTEGMAAQFRAHGYRVLSASQVSAAARSRGLSQKRHLSDSAVLKAGRGLDVDLVVYPRLLALGVQTASRRSGAGRPAAVVHVRVLNANTRAAIYSRQVAHEFAGGTPGNYRLTQPVANTACEKVTRMYFQRQAGRRAERRGS